MFLYGKPIHDIRKAWLLLWGACILAQWISIVAAFFHVMFLLAPQSLPHMQDDGQIGLSLTALLVFIPACYLFGQAERSCITHF